MRGDTGNRLVGAALTAPATLDLVSRAERATTLVDVQRVVAELRALAGVREAALETVSTVTPGSVAAEAVAPGLVLIPIGVPSWRLALRVRTRDATADERLRPAVAAVAAAAERCLATPCRAQPADRWPVAEPLARRLLAGDRAAVVVIDPAVGWAGLSEAFELLLGYDRQAPPDVSALDLVHPDDHGVAVGSFVAACAGHPTGGPFDLRVRDTNGRWRTLEVVVRGYVDEPGVGAVAYLGLDVTGQRADERAHREEVARLKAGTPATTADASFVPTVAHELRGPLSSVVAFAHLLGDPDSGGLNEDQQQYLDVIDRNANRLLRLIEELLLLSRLQNGRLPLQRTPVPVATLIEPVVSDCKLTAEAAGLSLTWDCVDGPELMCDEARIQQVLNSLVANALKFTPPGGRISVAAFPTGAGWQLTVTDTGIGIPADEQPKLFSPFFRASNVGAGGTAAGTPGAGLGLMISQAIVELHDGEIEVASTEGVGTTVTVTLPETPAGPARSMKDGGRG